MAKTNQKENKFIDENYEAIRSDYPTYAYVNIRIKNKRAKVQRLILNKLQQKLWQLEQECIENNKPLRFYIVKSRQTGSTTYWIGRFHHLTSLNSERNCLLIAHDDDGAKGLSDKFQNVYLRSNPKLQPKVRNMNRGEIYFATPLAEYNRTGEIGLDCHVDCLTAAKQSIGRSYTYQYALITEFGLYEENGIDIKSMFGALFQAVPEEAGTYIVIETTAKGEGFAKDYYENDNNGFTKIFISWIADDTYTIELPYGEYFDLSETEDSVYGNEYEVKEQIEKELLYWDVSNNLKDDPVELYHQTMCRLMWRRRTIHQKCQDDKQTFKHEYPLTVQDAFSTSAMNVFPSRYTERYLKQIKDDPVKPKRYEYIHNEDLSDDNPRFHSTLYGELKVYEPPIEGKLYAIGGDGAQGIEGGDPSALVVLKLPELTVVALYEGIIPPHHFAGCGYYLSKAYNNALLGIELNDKGGYSAVQELDANYRDCNLYYQSTNAKDIKYGWTTNAISRSVMINDAKQLMIDDEIHIYDETLLKQIRWFVKHPNGKLAATTGKKDDLVMAMMIAIQMGKETHIPRPKETRKVAPKMSMVGLLKQMDKRRKRRGLRV